MTESGYGSGWYRMLGGWKAVEQGPRERERDLAKTDEKSEVRNVGTGPHLSRSSRDSKLCCLHIFEKILLLIIAITTQIIMNVTRMCV